MQREQYSLMLFKQEEKFIFYYIFYGEKKL